ncbi:MAG: hypothetical protein MZW92_78825 [Comamonadaceae bacterium]|nr:hypothetical protein [Comamonadaceae bacterium]
MILSDNVGPAAFPADGVWRWATITDPGDAVRLGDQHRVAGPDHYPVLLRPQGHRRLGDRRGRVHRRTEGLVAAEAHPEFWKALSVGHDVTTPLVVSAVDVGDLLESSPQIATRQIRVEFNLLQSVAASDTELGQYVGLDKCAAPPTVAPYSIGCFAAFGMSGAVPATEQSINEMQGNDFGPGPASSLTTGTLTLLDPSTVRAATTPDGTAIPISALVLLPLRSPAHPEDRRKPDLG